MEILKFDFLEMEETRHRKFKDAMVLLMWWWIWVLDGESDYNTILGSHFGVIFHYKKLIF